MLSILSILYFIGIFKYSINLHQVLIIASQKMWVCPKISHSKIFSQRFLGIPLGYLSPSTKSVSQSDLFNRTYSEKFSHKTWSATHSSTLKNEISGFSWKANETKCPSVNCKDGKFLICSMPDEMHGHIFQSLKLFFRPPCMAIKISTFTYNCDPVCPSSFHTWRFSISYSVESIDK